MANRVEGLLDEVAGYYAGRLAEHGSTARGVDWNGEESQLLRFRQLCKIVGDESAPRINDLGCGYGALVEFLASHYPDFDYLGCDISQEMVDAASRRLAGDGRARFEQGSVPSRAGDYGVASGIFNVRFGRADDEWAGYMGDTLDRLHETSLRGFAFNCLTSYSDADRMRDNLYYADPLAWFDRCKRRYSRNVALLHDYGLYEFTILVRK